MPILTIALLISSWLLFIAGILLPFASFTSLYFFTQTPSLLGIISGLAQQSDYVLAVILLAFSILIPTGKLMILTLIGMPGRSSSMKSQLASQLSHISKWSMMDIMILALVIFSAKSSGWMTAFSLPGAWCFASSALLSGVSGHLLSIKISKSEAIPHQIKDKDEEL